MTIERFLGAVAVIGGILLLLYGIPANVEKLEYDVILQPRVFPQIGAIIIVVAGTLQFFFSKSKVELPSLRDFVRVLIVCGLIIASVFVMERFGFLVGAALLMAAVMYLVYERRPIWLIVAIAVMPVLIWVIFEVVLRRPLP